MSQLVITTVGTSLLDNLNLKPDKSLRTRFANARQPYIEDAAAELKSRMTDGLAHKSIDDHSLSAELESIHQIIKKHPDIEVVLLCTDTILSNLCAEQISKRLEGIPTTIQVISGLVVDQADAPRLFEEEGVPNLIAAIRDLLKKVNNEQVKAGIDIKPILNITGGYKGVIPVMTIIGQLFDLDCFYLYEGSESLIHLGKLPVSFDWSMVSYYGPYIQMNELKRSNLEGKELEAVRDLDLMGIFKENEQKTKFKRTIIGELFADYIEVNHPGALNALGFLMEYKVFEYLVQYKKREYRNIQHSVKALNGQGPELDLLCEHNDGNAFTVMEVKSYIQVQKSIRREAPGMDNNAKTLGNQIERQFASFKNNNVFPVEYVLVIHKQYFFSITSILTSIKEMAEIVRKCSDGKTKFSAWYFNLDFGLRDRTYFKNPYARIGSYKLSPQSVKKINL